jgi:hypothetical protein
MMNFSAPLMDLGLCYGRRQEFSIQLSDYDLLLLGIVCTEENSSMPHLQRSSPCQLEVQIFLNQLFAYDARFLQLS